MQHLQLTIPCTWPVSTPASCGLHMGKLPHCVWLAHWPYTTSGIAPARPTCVLTSTRARARTSCEKCRWPLYRTIITCHLPQLKEVNNFLSRKSSLLSISSCLRVSLFLLRDYKESYIVHYWGAITYISSRTKIEGVFKLYKHSSQRHISSRRFASVFLHSTPTPLPLTTYCICQQDSESLTPLLR